MELKVWKKMLMTGKFFLDLGFQSRGRWALNDRKHYLYNLCSELAPSKLIVCSIKGSLALIDPYLDNNGNPTNKDYIYFKNLEDQGYEWIIIDGNNRDISLLAFLGYFQAWDENGAHKMITIEEASKAGLIEKNAGSLPKTDWHYRNTITEPYFDRFRLEKDTPYNKLSIDQQRMIDKMKLSICEYVTNSVDDLGLIFDAVNCGCRLCSQEMRNAWVRKEITKFVRDFTSLHSEVIQSISALTWGRRGGDEMVAQMHSYSSQDKDINQSELNLLYQNDLTSEWKKTTKHAKFTFDILTEIGLVTVKKKNITRGNVLDMYDLIRTLDGSDGQKYKIKKKAFAKWWSDTLHRLKSGDLKDKVWYISASQESQYEKFSAGVGEPGYKPFEENYSQAIRELGKRYGRPQRLSKWLELLMEDPNVDKIITSVDSQRIFIPSQTYQIWLNQDKKSLKSGNVILLKDLFNKEKYQTDHIVDHALGGLTTVENGEVMEVEYHKEKTKNTWYNKNLTDVGTEVETVSDLETIAA